MIKHGAEVNVPGFEGDTPLHDAVVNNHVEVRLTRKVFCFLYVKVTWPVPSFVYRCLTSNVFGIFKVVNMLLSCAANPHQTNAKRKKPTDLISSKEMNDIFNLHGVEDTAFEKRDIKIRSEESTISGSAEKVLYTPI